MTSDREQIIESLNDREYRHALSRQFRRRVLAFQLRAMRKSRRLSQEQLGSLVGMTQTSISELETPGLRSPNIETLERLAEALDVDLVSHFGRFSQLASRMADLSESDLSVPSYDQELVFGLMRASEADETHSNISYWRGTFQPYQAPLLPDNGTGLADLTASEGHLAEWTEAAV